MSLVEVICKYVCGNSGQRLISRFYLAGCNKAGGFRGDYLRDLPDRSTEFFCSDFHSLLRSVYAQTTECFSASV